MSPRGFVLLAVLNALLVGMADFLGAFPTFWIGGGYGYAWAFLVVAGLTVWERKTKPETRGGR